MVAAIVLAALGGLIIGSFLNVVAYRLPRGESLAHPPSHCPSCDAPI
jgi:leader peptidase (prepilin peptidase)/N-methyltransferase